VAGINIQLADILDYFLILTDGGGVSVYGAVNLSSSSIQTPFMQFSIDKILFFHDKHQKVGGISISEM